jgi:hypothetical protein
MNAEAYMKEFVGPAIADFEAKPGSRRHAFIACVVTFHCIDYIARPSANNRNDFRKENRDFAIVDLVCHAFKHSEGGHLCSPTQPSLKVDEVTERPPATYDTAVWDQSVWDDSVGGVQLNGQEDLLTVVKRAAAFLQAKIEKFATASPSRSP